jgi:hypothetical protein
MRAPMLPLVIALLSGFGAPSPAFAQTEAKADAETSAALEPVRPKRGGVSPLTITGTSLAGLGGATIMASGICWLVAATAASRLDEDCPGKVCVEGSTGARSLETARDAKSAAIVLFAIGLPMTTGGVVLLLYADPRDRRRTLRLTPSVGPDRAGADFHLRF